MKNFSYRQVVLLLLAVFLSGAVAGGFGVSLYMARTVSAVTSPAPPLSPREWRNKYVGDMRHRLQLSDEQVQKLNVILDETKARYDAAKLRRKPEMDQIHDEQVANIRAMLDANQAAEYERFRQERERERRKNQEEQQKRDKQAEQASRQAGK